jgi:hypothetical protein
MRVILAGLVGLLCAGPLAAQEPAKRFGVEADPKGFPQATPTEALASVLKAIDLKRPDYVLAHLADPAFVDSRVKSLGGDFAALVEECAQKLVNDPGAARQLGRFLKEGEWAERDAAATVRLKDVGDRTVSFRKVEGRWVMENQYRVKK